MHQSWENGHKRICNMSAAVPTKAPVVVRLADTEEGNTFLSAVKRILLQPGGRVAFDCEGVDLSRLGTVEIISICFPSKEVFLVDFGQKPTCLKVVNAVKTLMESNVTKIIHDCRMDCDALYHIHGIRVNNVHDTSCFHEAITYMENKNLNDVLRFNGMRQNTIRDSNVYKLNPSFWATRPLNSKMIEWASSDVDKLFELADQQLRQISPVQKARAEAKSQLYSKLMLDMKVQSKLGVRNPGLFVGRGGVNIRSTEKELGVFCYQKSDGWFVYYKTDAALDRLRRKMTK